MRPLSDYNNWKFHFDCLKASIFISQKRRKNYADIVNMSYKDINLLSTTKIIYIHRFWT